MVCRRPGGTDTTHLLLHCIRHGRGWPLWVCPACPARNWPSEGRMAAAIRDQGHEEWQRRATLPRHLTALTKAGDARMSLPHTRWNQRPAGRRQKVTRRRTPVARRSGQEAVGRPTTDGHARSRMRRGRARRGSRRYGEPLVCRAGFGPWPWSCPERSELRGKRATEVRRDAHEWMSQETRPPTPLPVHQAIQARNNDRQPNEGRESAQPLPILPVVACGTDDGRQRHTRALAPRVSARPRWVSTSAVLPWGRRACLFR